MRGYTIKESIDLLEKEVKKTGGGTTPAAADVSYSNTSSGLSADDVQEAIDELAGRTVSAADVSYSNTSSGLSADKVQGAIDELAGRCTYSTTEKVVGKWIDNSPVYEKVVEIGALPNATTKTVAHGISDLKFMLSMVACAHNSTSGNDIIVPTVSTINLNQQVGMYCGGGNINIISASDVSAYDSCYAILRYVKNEPTRTRKSKKEE